jgi:glucokinase-like ROK family protein
MTCIALTIDIGGSKLMIGLLSENGHILYRERKEWDSLDKESVVNLIVDSCHQILEKNKKLKVTLVGVNVPGLVDKENGMWVEACFSGIQNVPIAQILKDAFHIPVYIDNDVNNCALAEKVYGCCRNNTNFAWLTISNGCGGALYLNDSLYTGTSGSAGEFGHINVVAHGGNICGCGNSGCLEAQASGQGIVKNYTALGGETHFHGRMITAKDIAAIAKTGDLVAIKTYQMEGECVGKACAAIINITNPEKIVIGGGVSESFDLFYDQIIESTNRYIYIKANKNVSIERTALGSNAALIGAAACAFLGQARSPVRN